MKAKISTPLLSFLEFSQINKNQVSSCAHSGEKKNRKENASESLSCALQREPKCLFLAGTKPFLQSLQGGGAVLLLLL